MDTVIPENNERNEEHSLESDLETTAGNLQENASTSEEKHLAELAEEHLDLDYRYHNAFPFTLLREDDLHIFVSDILDSYKELVDVSKRFQAQQREKSKVL